MAQGEQLVELQNGFKSLQKEHEVAEENVREIASALTKLLRAFNTVLTLHDAANDSVHDITIALTDLIGAMNTAQTPSMDLSDQAIHIVSIAVNITRRANMLVAPLAREREKDLMDKIGDDDNEF